MSNRVFARYTVAMDEFDFSSLARVVQPMSEITRPLGSPEDLVFEDIPETIEEVRARYER